MITTQSKIVIRWGVLVHLVSFFVYSIYNNLIIVILNYLIFKQSHSHIYFIGNICPNGKFLNPYLQTIYSIAFLAIRITSTLLIAMTMNWLPKSRKFLNEGLYFTYEDDLLYILLLPIPIFMGEEPYRYFISASPFFLPEYVNGPIAIWWFTCYASLCLFIHYQTKQFNLRALTLRIAVSLASLILYSLVWVHAWRFFFSKNSY